MEVRVLFWAPKFCRQPHYATKLVRFFVICPLRKAGPHTPPPRYYTLSYIHDDFMTQNIMEFQLTGEYVELCNLLKLAGIADSGGQGKALVAMGEVMVDGQQESRKTAKIRAGQQVTCMGRTINIVAD